MYPTLLESSSGAAVHTYGLFIVLAFTAAFLLVHVRASKIGVNPDRLLLVYFAAAIGGILGGRLLYAFAVEPARTLADPLSLFAFSGFAFYGGVIGGALGVAAFSIPRGINPWKLADLAGPAVLVGLGVGRFACFFAGCCHGGVAPFEEPGYGLLPASFEGGQIWLSSVFPYLTLEFHGGVSRILDIPLYPTQIWSAFTGIGLAAALFTFWRYRRFDGQIAALWLMVEPPTRIFIEIFRADERGYAVTWEVSDWWASFFPGMAQAGEDMSGAIMGLTTSQGIGLGMMVLGFVIYAVRYNSGREDEVEEEEDGIDEELLAM